MSQQTHPSKPCFSQFCKDRQEYDAMGWFHGFKLHPVCNNKGELLSFVLMPANIDDQNPETLKTLTKKLFGDKGYISQSLFETLFNDGIHPVTGLRSNMKNCLMPLRDRILLRKRSVIETIKSKTSATLNIPDIVPLPTS
jgi:hypothetical protein